MKLRRFRLLLAASISLVVFGLLGCSASVVWRSDPPGAYASGNYSDTGAYYENQLPTTQYWALSKLPQGFPTNCGMVTSPKITWPDGVTIAPQSIKVCHMDSEYVFKKPFQNNAGSRPNYKPSPTAEVTIEDAKAKCTSIGFKNGTDGFGKCVLQLTK